MPLTEPGCPDICDFLCSLAEVDRSRIALLGFSGGAAVSVLVAARDTRVSAVAACACPAEFRPVTGDEGHQLIERFRSIGIIRDADFPPSVEDWLRGFREVTPVDYVAGISPRPLLIVHGSDDDVVPVSHAGRLFARAGEPKQIRVVEGAGHRLRLNDAAMSIAIDWLKSTLRAA